MDSVSRHRFHISSHALCVRHPSAPCCRMRIPRRNKSIAASSFSMPGSADKDPDKDAGQQEGMLSTCSGLSLQPQRPSTLQHTLPHTTPSQVAVGSCNKYLPTPGTHDHGPEIEEPDFNARAAQASSLQRSLKNKAMLVYAVVLAGIVAAMLFAVRRRAFGLPSVLPMEGQAEVALHKLRYQCFKVSTDDGDKRRNGVPSRATAQTLACPQAPRSQHHLWSRIPGKCLLEASSVAVHFPRF